MCTGALIVKYAVLVPPLFEMFSVHVLPHCKTSQYAGYCLAQRNKFLLNIPYSAKRPIKGQPEFSQYSDLGFLKVN
jgi:hypothetical protein